MGSLLIRLREQSCAAVIPWGETKRIPAHGCELRNSLTLGTGDADLRFYRVFQSFVSFVTISRRVTQICVFTRGWIPRTLHLITQYLEPFFE
jgi:hypothetical protein